MDTCVQQDTWRNGCGNNNKDEDNSPKNLNDKKHVYVFVYVPALV